MPPEIILDDEDYASEEDSDFAPDAAPAEDKAESSDEESEADEPAVKAKPKSTKRKRGDEEAEDLGFENSGDEAIIGEGAKARKRRLKKAKAKGKSVEELEDDEGGEGRFNKDEEYADSRVKIEKKPLADTSAATIDVDAVWAAMISGKPITIPNENTPKPSTEQSAILSPKSSSISRTSIPRNGRELRSPSTLGEGPDSMVMIKRTYNFAGKLHVEQKLVPRNSAEAKLFLASQPDPSHAPTPETISSDPFTKPKRPPKLARRSVFEPIVEGLLKRTDLHFGVRKESDVELTGITGKEKKLNTVEKSAMDWAGFVDKAGIKDDLDAAGKSKGAYRARQEFLARVEQKKEEEARRARGLPI